jgi:hypothetical protein
VRARLDVDDLERLEASARTPKAHRDAAAALLTWAEEHRPDDGVSPAELVSAAAWHLDQAGDDDAALLLHRRAVVSEGTTTPDARCTLHAALLDAGRLDEARQVADDLRRSRPRIVDIASMAEVLEVAGDLEQAHRWVAMGVSRLDVTADTDWPEDYEVEVLLDVRRRVRQALGFPPDELDQ